MSLIADIQKALEVWPAWKRLTGVPDRVAALEARLDALEAKPLKAPGKPCPSCGAFSFRLVASRKSSGPFGDLGALAGDYACSECEFAETREVDRM